jgi:competence protein ComEA
MRRQSRQKKKEESMKKLLLALIMWIAIYGIALAAVNINTATKEELTSLKGIGDKRAQEIIDYRTKHGPFKSVDDLEKVPGIGPGIMKQIRSDVTTTGKTTIEKPAARKTKAEDAKPGKTEAKKGEPGKGDAMKSEKAKAKVAEKSKADEKGKTAAAKPDDKSAKATGTEKKTDTKDEKKMEKK